MIEVSNYIAYPTRYIEVLLTKTGVEEGKGNMREKKEIGGKYQG